MYYKWPNRSMGAYSNIISQLTVFEARMAQIDKDFLSDPSRSLMVLCEESINVLQPSFHFLFNLEKLKRSDGCSDDFREHLSTDFCLGPHGLGPIINYMSQLYDSIISAYDRRSMVADEVKICITKINIIAGPLETLLVAFQSSISRGLYDPKGFSDLQDAIKNHRTCFSVCLLSSSIYVN